MKTGCRLLKTSPAMLLTYGQKKTRRSFAPGRFPVYNLMKSFKNCGPIITASSSITAASSY